MLQALDGYKILDLTLRAPGPFCTWVLADLGAGVLRIEQPQSRARDDRGLEGVSAQDEERRASQDVLGRGKRSIALNLKTPEARAVFQRLCAGSDVVIEGFRPGVVARLGADYETVRAINPRIVYCSLSGFGQTGPYRMMPGHDINYIALSGALSLIGPPGGPPAIPSNLLADFAGGGLQAAVSILAALLHRERGGAGQYIDVAMTDGVVALLAMAYAQHFATGATPPPGEGPLTGGQPFYQVYRTADDKYVSIGCLESWFFENLCRLLGMAEYIPWQQERAKWDEMRAGFTERFRQRTRAEWWALFQQHDICGAPVYTLDEAAADPHLHARGMFQEVQHPGVGPVRQVGVAPKLSATPGRAQGLAPTVGQHTEEVLQSLGYSSERIASLRAAGAVR